ncbi:hypothetical protein EDB81DRAFT_734389 [Dactylonectria macrodidyma]|uniref:Uncharacterized protein n=1 Tax=Dactylonectria macrodidyma TaxID=307937 RepID=A0A9P9IBL1_9HYPO|nr:hypothetical protein EDB81DRAFT_734389 [Dactylonectria macrodidyma]
MDSLIFRTFMLLNSPQDSGEEVQLGSSVIEIQIDPTGLAGDMISVDSREQPQKSTKPTVRLFKSLNELKSSPEPADDSATGFRAATFQWRGANPKPWCILEGYDFFDSTYSKQGIASRAVRYVRKELAELAGRSRPRWTRTVRRLRLEGRLNGVLRASIVCETHTAKAVASEIRKNPLSLLASTERFLTELGQLGEIYRPQRTRRNLKQIFLLQLHHANLNLFSDFLQSFATDYATPRMFMFDPRQAELRRWNLKAIVTDSQLYRRFTSLGAELTATTESLLDVVLALEDDTRLAALGAEIRGCSKDVTTRLSRMSDDLDHHLQLLSLSRDMNQSGNVQMLTLLATIFLPLSLSAGVLSMQSRFKDLGDLLYDFFGVVVLLAAVVALLLVAMFVFSLAKELESRLWRYRLYKAYLRPALLATMAAIALIFGALVLTSFVVGMFKDVVLGAKILGYGILAAIGAPVVITVAVLVVRWITGLMGRAVDKVPRWEIGRQKEKQDDLEGDLGREPKGKEAAVNGSEDPGVKVQAEPLGPDSQDATCTPPTARAADKSLEDVERRLT